MFSAGRWRRVPQRPPRPDRAAATHPAGWSQASSPDRECDGL